MEENVVKLNCPTCGRRLKLGKNSLAKIVVCPKCNARFRIEQDTITIVAEEREFFRPPIQDAFEDIDSIIDNRTAPDASSRGKRQERKQDMAVQRVALEQWQQQKKVTTKQDESLNRNATGLLILSLGLSTIPVFASDVEGFNYLLVFLPVIAVGLAFVATFMLTYSLRRSSVASIILSLFPLLLISTVSLVAYVFFVQPVQALPDATNQVAGELQDEESGELVIEEKLLDKDAVENNTAEAFAPPKLKQPESNLRPVFPRSEIAGSTDASASPVDTVETSQLRPSETVATSGGEDRSGDQRLKEELLKAKQLADDREKVLVLRERIERDLDKALISKGNPKGLQSNLSFTEVVGIETVYGSALFSHSPIRGFDVVRSKNVEHQAIDMIVPVLGRAEFTNSLVAPAENSLLGIRVNIVEKIIAGVQPVFGVHGESLIHGDWVGLNGDDNPKQVESILSDRQIHGVVVYRDRLKPVGIGLVVGERVALPPN